MMLRFVIAAYLALSLNVRTVLDTDVIWELVRECEGCCGYFDSFCGQYCAG